MNALPDRERQAVEEMAATEVRRPMAWLLVLAFLALLPLVGAIEVVAPRPAPVGGHRFVPHRTGREAIAQAYRKGGLLGADDELLETIDSLNSWFERESSLDRLVRPPLQRFLLDELGYGNGVVRAGRDGWLFWEQELSAITGPPFLESDVIAARHYRGDETDPATALVDFADQLRRRAIQLVVVPVPGKAGVEAQTLAGPEARLEMPIRNPSIAELERRLAAVGALLVDPASLLAERSAAGHPQYLRGDSHWRPEAAEATAELLAAKLRDRLGLQPMPGFVLRRGKSARQGMHDLVRLLGFPGRGDDLFYETVEAHPIVSADRAADDIGSTSGGVMLLGDSYSAIYSAGFERWGDDAGLPDQLAYFLHRPVARRIVQAGGAFDSHEALARELAKQPALLDPVKVVVYEFAARELVLERWHRVDLDHPSEPRRR